MVAITPISRAQRVAPPETLRAFGNDPKRCPLWSVVTEQMAHVEDGSVGETPRTAGFDETGIFTDLRDTE